MGRHSRFLYIADRGSLIKKLNRELCSNNENNSPKNNLQAKANCENSNNKNNKISEKVAEEGEERKVIYGPSNLPKEVILMYGLLEIKPSVLDELINELYKSKI